MNKSTALKVLEFVSLAVGYAAVIFLFVGQVLSYNPIWDVLTYIFLIVFCVLMCVLSVLWTRSYKKKKYLITAILFFVLAVIAICVAIGII